MPVERAAILLAAGAGSRFAGTHHKLFANLPARGADPAGSVVERSLAHVVASSIGPVIVVTGAVEDLVTATDADGDTPAVIVCHNPSWADGQSTSLRVGLDAAGRLGATSVVVGLADQPFVEPDAWRAVAAADGPIVVATYDGHRGNPVKLDATVWPLLDEPARHDPDAGARALMRVRPDLVREVPCTGSPADIDTEEDLRRWQRS
jgi:CTP:molybdopterin cytidylyltransferase MocA